MKNLLYKYCLKASATLCCHLPYPKPIVSYSLRTEVEAWIHVTLTKQRERGTMSYRWELREGKWSSQSFNVIPNVYNTVTELKTEIYVHSWKHQPETENSFFRLLMCPNCTSTIWRDKQIKILKRDWGGGGSKSGEGVMNISIWTPNFVFSFIPITPLPE